MTSRKLESQARTTYAPLDRRGTVEIWRLSLLLCPTHTTDAGAGTVVVLPFATIV
jgi:hypothetical protein